jgi:type I restriction enzyme S subunit
VNERQGLPTTWALAALGELGKWQGGGTPNKAVPEYWSEGTIPWVSPKDMKVERIVGSEDRISSSAVAQSSAKLIAPGAVLVVTRSGILAHSLPVAVTDVEATVNQDLKALTPVEGIGAKYVSLALQAFEWEILQRCRKSGTTVASIEFPRFLAFEIPIAPLPEQRRIVAEIETQFTRLDAAVAALKRARGNLKRYRAAVLDRTFQGPRVPVSTVLNSPLINGRSVPDRTGGFPVLRLTALKIGWLDFDQFKEGAWTEEQAKPFLVSEDDFFVARGNGSLALVGRGGLARAPKIPVAFPDTMIRVRCDTEKILPQFLRLVWDSPSMRKQIETAARTTAGIHKINQRDIQGFVIPVPCLDDQHRLVDEAEACLTVADHIQIALDANLQRAERMRQSILRKAFAGQLVPQDPADEPASVLLERIRAARGASATGQKRVTGSRRRGRNADEVQQVLL